MDLEDAAAQENAYESNELEGVSEVNLKKSLGVVKIVKVKERETGTEKEAQKPTTLEARMPEGVTQGDHT